MTLLQIMGLPLSPPPPPPPRAKFSKFNKHCSCLASTHAHLILQLFLSEGLPLSLLPLLERSLFIVHPPSPGQVVLGLAQVVCTLSCLVCGKVEVELHPVSLLAQVDKESGSGRIDEILIRSYSRTTRNITEL